MPAAWPLRYAFVDYKPRYYAVTVILIVAACSYLTVISFLRWGIALARAFNRTRSLLSAVIATALIVAALVLFISWSVPAGGRLVLLAKSDVRATARAAVIVLPPVIVAAAWPVVLYAVFVLAFLSRNVAIGGFARVIYAAKRFDLLRQRQLLFRSGMTLLPIAGVPLAADMMK